MFHEVVIELEPIDKRIGFVFDTLLLFLGFHSIVNEVLTRKHVVKTLLEVLHIIIVTILKLVITKTQKVSLYFIFHLKISI